jgi:hypothetical protein
MADNVAITAGTGTNVASDERSIAGVTVQVQRMADIGSSAIANNQVTVDTTVGGVIVAAARETRRSILIMNRGTVAIYVGNGTVSSTNGVQVNAGEGIVLSTTAQIKSITASSSATVHYIEEYDS